MPVLEAERTGTRWGRAALAFVPGMLCAGGLGTAMATGAVASSLSVQNGSGTLATSSLYGTDFGLAIAPQTYETPAGTTATRNVMRLAFADGQVNGLCISVPQSFAGVSYTVMLTATDNDPGTWEIKASNILIDLTSATGTLNLDGVVGPGYTDPEVQIGADASRVAVNGFPSGLGGGGGWWGIKAGIAKFGPVTATVQSLAIQGLLTLPNLHLSVAMAGAQCPTPAAPTGQP